MIPDITGLHVLLTTDFSRQHHALVGLLVEPPAALDWSADICLARPYEAVIYNASVAGQLQHVPFMFARANGRLHDRRRLSLSLSWSRSRPRR